MRTRSDTNSAAAVLLAACGLAIVAAAAVANDDPLCSASLSVILGNGPTTTTSSRRPASSSSSSSENDVLHHEGVAYPADQRWTDGNLTYGCVCRLRECVRKCCADDEVLREDLTKKPMCEKMPRDGNETTTPQPHAARTPELRLSPDRQADEIQDVVELRDHFRLVYQDFVCPGGIYALDPEYKEDKYVLQANGSLVTADGKVFPLWDYCLDWQVTYERIGVLVCLTPRPVSPEKNTAHLVGIVVSIPFLLATFLVYAITPELRNLYGKTLMCYVVCLIVAYLFLILANYIYLSATRALCLVTGKWPLRRPFFSSVLSLFSLLPNLFRSSRDRDG